jgi:alpha-beta hydrolase superfamily lysophospholipase
MNEHVAKNTAPFLQISQYLSERGFAVLRYDKRGIGANGTVLDSNVCGNTAFANLKQDAKKTDAEKRAELVHQINNPLVKGNNADIPLKDLDSDDKNNRLNEIAQ